MDVSEASESRLRSNYRQLVPIIIILVLFAIFGARYFELLPGIVTQGLKVEHTRLLNIVAMTRSKWLNEGKPDSLLLNWIKQENLTVILNDFEETVPTKVMMSNGGWPLPAEFSSKGCRILWYQLLGIKADDENLIVRYDSRISTCLFISPDESHLDYQLLTGEVNFVSG